ncbi:hypothetical protein EMIHUDRAFT_200800 [Emiliania huxleyi CCMP1516]|uniref:SAP domain-containing protein n=2 Tax=Emiliania huxleyi TaxID=2903 RepID=A0A0D3KR63_EMIH1|nr:hypothetical protein EMIHUDRAFT_200800 [Emiliania huxleyi CCMP1516]EOD38248.1 hypothetical protein EMIHUDRAFT_200800 [Emiliania huxleyi CCMP1516]|eukprot:XP_005790677.1 hypothetical protein EMIHUDRAFT_200800 [Emiliania huxleyi CCMP1516]
MPRVFGLVKPATEPSQGKESVFDLFASLKAPGMRDWKLVDPSLASTFSKKELSFILRRHSIQRGGKKEDLALELMALIRSDGLSAPDDPIVGLFAANVAPAESQDETQAPPGWLADGGAACSQSLAAADAPASFGFSNGNVESQTEQQSQSQQSPWMGIDRVPSQAAAVQPKATLPSTPRTVVPRPSSQHPDCITPPDLAREAVAVVHPPRRTIGLSAAERELIDRLKSEAAVAGAIWPDFDALRLDFSLMPRKASRSDTLCSKVAASASRGVDRGGALSPSAVGPLAHSPPAAASLGARSSGEPGVEHSALAPEPAPKRPRQGKSAEEVSDLISKARRIVRGVSEQQAASALAAADYCLGPALAALRRALQEQLRSRDEADESSSCVAAADRKRRPVQRSLGLCFAGGPSQTAGLEDSAGSGGGSRSCVGLERLERGASEWRDACDSGSETTMGERSDLDDGDATEREARSDDGSDDGYHADGYGSLS